MIRRIVDFFKIILMNSDQRLQYDEPMSCRFRNSKFICLSLLIVEASLWQSIRVRISLKSIQILNHSQDTNSTISSSELHLNLTLEKKIGSDEDAQEFYVMSITPFVFLISQFRLYSSPHSHFSTTLQFKPQNTPIESVNVWSSVLPWRNKREI